MKQILILLVLFATMTASAQAPKQFSSESAAFFKELKGFMELTNKKETEKLLDQFEIIWMKEPKFTDDQQTIIIHTANDMLKKRMKAFPDYGNYLEALMGFTKSGRDLETFKKWHTSLDKMLTGTSRRYGDYLEICAELFDGNILYVSSSTKWVANTGNYTFEFDTVPRINFPAMDLTCFAKNDSSNIYGIKGY